MDIAACMVNSNSSRCSGWIFRGAPGWELGFACPRPGADRVSHTPCSIISARRPRIYSTCAYKHYKQEGEEGGRRRAYRCLPRDEQRAVSSILPPKDPERSRDCHQWLLGAYTGVPAY